MPPLWVTVVDAICFFMIFAVFFLLYFFFLVLFYLVFISFSPPVFIIWGVLRVRRAIFLKDRPGHDPLDLVHGVRLHHCNRRTVTELLSQHRSCRRIFCNDGFVEKNCNFFWKTLSFTRTQSTASLLRQKMITPTDIWGAPVGRLTCGPTKLTCTQGLST